MAKTIYKWRNVAMKYAGLAGVAVFVSCGQSSNAGTTKTAISTTSNAVSPTETQMDKNNTLVEVALTFINSYVDHCNDMNDSTGVIEWVYSNDLTTNSFKNEVKRLVEEAFREDPETGLGLDPIFAAQDYPHDGFEFDSLENTTNLIVVKGKEWPDFKLVIKMALENNKWLVDGCGIVNTATD